MFCKSGGRGFLRESASGRLLTDMRQRRQTYLIGSYGSGHERVKRRASYMKLACVKDS